MVMELWEYMKAHWIIYSKYVDFMEQIIAQKK